jgi:hypothetical protein
VPAAVFSVALVVQSSPLGVPTPRPSHAVAGTPVPPTEVSVTLTVPFCATENE